MVDILRICSVILFCYAGFILIKEIFNIAINIKMYGFHPSRLNELKVENYSVYLTGGHFWILTSPTEDSSYIGSIDNCLLFKYKHSTLGIIPVWHPLTKIIAGVVEESRKAPGANLDQLLEE